MTTPQGSERQCSGFEPRPKGGKPSISLEVKLVIGASALFIVILWLLEL